MKAKRKENCWKKMCLRFYENDKFIYDKLQKIKDDTGLSFNEIILDLIKKGEVRIDNSMGEHNDLLRVNLYHLSRVGSNLNQLVKLLHSNSNISSDNIEKLLAEMSLTLTVLKGLLAGDKNDK